MRKLTVSKKGKKLWAVSYAESFPQKARGLMFSKNAFPLLFDFGAEAAGRNAIHSFFCPVFDAVFLDSQKKVVCVYRKIRAFKPLIVPCRPARFLIELPPGESGKVRLGEKLSWNPGVPG